MATITTGNVPKALSGGTRMAKLTTKARNAIPGGDFALPGRRYPVPDAAHGRAALSRVSQFGSPAEKAKVRAKVHRKFPGIGQHAHHAPTRG
jgi:hypothetical protein